MANLKTILMPYFASGVSGLYSRIYQVGTGYWLDNTDGVFRLTPGQINIPMTEVLPNMPSIYSINESRQVWTDGQYHAFAYDVSGFLFAGADFFVLDDIGVSLATLLKYMTLIKKIEEGNWELKDDKWIYYDTDGVTPLIEFAVYDKDGNPSMLNIFRRERL